MALRVGTDLVAVETVREALDTHGEHYLQRVYAADEVRDCSTPTGVDAERLAGRFAAKEAALKVLRPDDRGISWTTIRVHRDPAGWVELELSGEAAELAAEAGLDGFALSISHEGGFASAVVIARTASDPSAPIR